MSALLNPRHEKFARLVAIGNTLVEAFVCAGYAKRSAGSCSRRLAKTHAVRARISELQGVAAETAITQAAIDRRWVLSGLRKIAESGESEAARVRSYELIGKELNMFRSEEAWDGDVDSLLGKLSPEQYDRVIRNLEIQAAQGDPVKLAEFRAERKAIESGEYLEENIRQIGGTTIDVEIVGSN